MKPSMKLAALAALLALGGSASAETYIRITGSTAFRAATMNAIKNAMTLTAGGDGYAYNGTNFTGASFAIFKGTLTSNPGIGHVTVKCNWSGSVAGVRDVVQANAIGFPPDSTTVSSGGTTGYNSANNVNETPNVAMSDTYQGSTKYTSVSLSDNVVGVVPFAWVASFGAPSGITNMTPQLARGLFLGGYTSAALFTNNPADAYDQPAGTYVYAAGRDPFSGTRLTAFAEGGVGVKSTVVQYYAAGTGGTLAAPGISSNTPTEFHITEADVPNSVIAGDNGFVSGGNLADQMRYTTTSITETNNGFGPIKACFITYLGESDANRAVTGSGSSVTGTNSGNAKYLTYNGVNGFGGIATTFTGATVDGANHVTVSSTTGLVVGQAVKNSTQIPVDAYITSIDSATQFTIATPTGATTTAGASVSVTTSNLLPNAIRNGAYTFWGYEHLMYKTGGLSANETTVANKIRDQIKNVDYFASGLANNANMLVSRASDGGTVSPLY